MRLRRITAFVAASSGCALILAIFSSQASTNNFLSQTITFPTNFTISHFADLNNGGLFDLLALDPLEKKIFIYRQRAFGFTNIPDEVITLPRKTAWVAPFDVDAQPGLELVMSTAEGLVYCRRNGGMFEQELHSLIRVSQVFTNDDSPRLITLTTKDALPIISADKAVLYRCDNSFNWTSGAPASLQFKKTSFSMDRNEWTMGQNSSRSIHIRQSLRSKPIDDENNKPENDRIKKLLEELKLLSNSLPPEIRRVDINGDGQQDLIIWQLFPGLDTRTDVYIFLRGADGRLPEQPTQTLHCRGFPIPVRTTQLPITPVVDLKGDGTFELVLLEVKTALTSYSGVIDMLLSSGLELALTIRPFNHGAFSGNPTAAIPIRALMPIASLAPSGAVEAWPFMIYGDFNGDGRPDFLVRRSLSHWDIYFSTTDGSWFTPRPAMAFETSFEGQLEINDLNNDGCADIVLRASEGNRMAIFLSQPRALKGRNP